MRSLPVGPGAVQLDSERGVVAERANVRVGRPLERERVGNGVGVGRRAGELDGAVGVYNGRAGRCGDDGRGVLSVIKV